jgi:uncharacterized membrane protein YgdD (TMEM256/DUF423 family)
MGAKLWLLLAVVYGFLGVALGAFGAHALRERLAPDLLAVYRTGVEYQFWHVAALLAVGLLALHKPSPLLNAAGLSFAIGILLFSGSLYALALSGLRVLGAVTPFGGLAFLVGWLLLGLAVWRS